MAEKEQGCQVCRLLRIYLMCAAPLLILLALRPEGFQISVLERVNLIDMTAWGVGILLIVIVAWKAYNEFWR